MSKSKNTYLANCEVEYPESSSRLLAILFILKPVAPLPHYIVLDFFRNGGYFNEYGLTTCGDCGWNENFQ